MIQTMKAPQAICKQCGVSKSIFLFFDSSKMTTKKDDGICIGCTRINRVEADRQKTIRNEAYTEKGGQSRIEKEDQQVNAERDFEIGRTRRQLADFQKRVKDVGLCDAASQRRAQLTEMNLVAQVYDAEQVPVL